MNVVEKVMSRFGEQLKRCSKYKYVVLVMCVGAIMLMLPAGREADVVPGHVAENMGDVFDLLVIEEKLERVLSRVDGAGEVSVILALQGSSRQVLAQNTTSSQGNGTSQEEKEVVTVGQGTGVSVPVTLQEIYPVYQGALVVCGGADNPTVKLQMTQAVSALTGLGADKISVCKAK